MSATAPAKIDRRKDVIGWRREQFIACGLDELQASYAAHSDQIDLEQFRRIVKAGCAPGTAYNILR